MSAEPRDIDVEFTETQSLPRVMDPVVTMAAVQRYVEAERVRGRRVMIWSGAVFLLILLAVLVVFTVIGIFVLQRTRQAAEVVDQVQDRTAAYAAEVVGIAGRVGELNTGQTHLRGEFEQRETQRQSEARRLRSDLQRFSQWVAETQDSKAEKLTTLETRLRQMEGEAAAKDRALDDMRRQVADLKALVDAAAKARLNVAPPAVVARSAAGETEPAEPVPPDAASATTNGVLVTSSAVPPAAAGGGAAAPAGASPVIRVVAFPNGDRYEGEFKDGLFHGWGIYTYRTGDRYEGEFAGDLKHGKGTLTYANGDKYMGEFARDMKAGRGTLLFGNGDKYVGAFADDGLTGQGTMIYANSNAYTGEFRNGLKHGAGEFKYAAGDIYTGDFVADQREGQGTYLFADGSRYTGQFKAGRRHGNGHYTYATADQYLGEFKDGRKHGNGTFIGRDGVRIVGSWESDRLISAISQEKIASTNENSSATTSAPAATP